MTPAFSLDVARQYAREMAQKLVRVPMNEAARMREIRDFARLAATVYQREKARDWSPVQ